MKKEFHQQHPGEKPEDGNQSCPIPDSRPSSGRSLVPILQLRENWDFSSVSVQELFVHTFKKQGAGRSPNPKSMPFPKKTREKRYRRSWPMYLRLRKDRWKKVVTSDEAWFYLLKTQGKTRVQYLKMSQKRSEAELQPAESHPKGLMVWVAFSATGFFKPIFVEPGAKINADYYCKKVIEPFAKEFHEKFPNNDRIFHQDSAPAHSAKKTIALLKKMKIQFWLPSQCMPCSPDCAPCDFWLWGYLKSKVNKRAVTTINGLKKVIQEELSKIPLEMVERALRSWPKRCRQVYYNKGGHVENFK